MNIRRRHLLATLPLMSAAAMLGGCAVSTVNGVTTVTLNLNTLESYSIATKNGVATLLSIPLIATALGSAKIVMINAVVADMAAQVAALNAANKGVATLVFTANSVPAAVAAFEADAKAIMSDVVVVAGSLAGSLASNIVTTVDALQTILALAEAVAATTASATMPKMTQAQALAVLGVTK